MTSSTIMKKNVKLLPTSSKDMKIEDYNTDKYYAKRLEKYFSLLKQSSYSEKHKRPGYYFFFDNYDRDKENIFGAFQSMLLEDSGIEAFGASQSMLLEDSGIEAFGASQSMLLEDSGIEAFGASQSMLLEDSGIEEKYVLSEINRILDKIKNKIENMNNKIIALKSKIRELKWVYSIPCLGKLQKYLQK